MRALWSEPKLKLIIKYTRITRVRHAKDNLAIIINNVACEDIKNISVKRSDPFLTISSTRHVPQARSTRAYRGGHFPISIVNRRLVVKPRMALAGTKSNTDPQAEGNGNTMGQYLAQYSINRNI